MKLTLKALMRFSTALGLFTMLLGSSQAVIINQYTSETSWIDAVGTYTVEDFEDSTFAAPLLSITGDDVSISGGVLNDVIDQGPYSADTVFSFNPGVYGFGGTWDLAGPGGPGTEIVIRTSSGMYSLGLIPNTTEGTFWGFTIDEILMDIYLVEGTIYETGVETYTLDNLMMAGSLASVPEPTSLALLGLGLVGLGFSRRKRNTRI